MKATLLSRVRLTAASAILVLLTACATQSGPTYTLNTVQRADQAGTAHEVSCTGLLENSQTCMDVAKNVCQDEAVTPLGHVDGYKDGKPAGDPRKLTFVCGKQAAIGKL